MKLRNKLLGFNAVRMVGHVNRSAHVLTRLVNPAVGAAQAGLPLVD